MNNIFLICAIITACIAYIYKLDAPNEIGSTIMSWLTKGKIKKIELRKPWGCPLCITFWVTLIILLVVYPAYCWLSFVYAFSVKYIDYSITILEYFLDWVFIRLERIFNKNQF
jgi:hypothetical protein